MHYELFIEESDIIALQPLFSCSIFAKKYYTKMKKTQETPRLMVSDRAYCAIMTDCIKTLMAKGVLPHVFEVTVYVIQRYLESQVAPLNGDMFVMEFFRTFRPEMDRAIRRSAIARKAAETRRRKKQAETRQQQQQPEPPAPQPEPARNEQPTPPVKDERPAAPVIPDPVPAEITSPPLSRPRSRAIRCPGIEQMWDAVRR